MASITIRNLDERLKAKLRLRAAAHGRSMEEEARVILRGALSREARAAGDLARAIGARFREFGGVELTFEPRQPMREPVRLEP